MAQGGKTLQVAIPIFDGITALDAIGPYECLQSVENLNVVFVAEKRGTCSAGYGALILTATASFDEVPHPDIVIVPGGSGTRLLLDHEPILNWIRKVHETSLYTTSVCTGSLLLAAAGLLKGLNATTHWSAYDILEAYEAKPQAIRVVREGKIITSAGISAGIDMAITLVSLITNETTAKAVQLMLEYQPEPPFDSGSVAKAEPEVLEKAKMLALRSRTYALENYGIP